MTAPISAPGTAQFPSPIAAAGAPAANIDAELLPPPQDITSPQLQDAMTMMYLLLNARASTDMSNAQHQIVARQAAKDDAFKVQLDALRRAAEAQGEGSKGFFESLVDLVENVVVDLANFDFAAAITDPLGDLEDMWNSPKFWQDLEAGAGFIARAALIAGGIAATAATAGSAGPLVAGIALALSASGTIIQETGCLDSVVGEKAADWLGVGLQVSGSVVCFASAGAAGNSVVKTLTTATEVGGGAATVVTSGAHARNAQLQGDVKDAEADALAAQRRGEQMTRLVEWLVDGIREIDKSHQRAKETLGEAIDQHDQTQKAALFTSGRQLS